MNEKILFSETQKANQWWLWLLMMGISGIITFLILLDYKNHGRINPGSLIGLGINILMTALMFFFMKLETRISDEGIHVRLFPFHLSFIKIEWNKIAKSFVREYSPLREYGGWGIKYGFSGGKAYNMSGNKGIQLVLADGSKLLIGTNKPEEVREILQRSGHLKE
jgi:hypothetical protein